MTRPSGDIRYDESTASVDWAALKDRLASDSFDNGRSPDQLRRSFENSFAVVFAWHGTEVIGTARALADGVCNAYIIDVWTYSPYRRMKVGGTMLAALERSLRGHHIALFTEDAVDFYRIHGYTEERVGMSKVLGKWLQNEM